MEDYASSIIRQIVIKNVCYSLLFVFGSLPDFRSASWIIYSICPFELLNSSAAHLSTAFKTSGSILNTKGFFFAIINNYCISLFSLKVL